MPYLIDGNNVLGSWGGPAVPGDGRMEVVRRVAAFCNARGARASLVFDGAPFRPELGDQELGRVSLRFAPQGRDADSVIRAIVDAAARPGEILVVTSDKALYSYAHTRGAVRAAGARVERARAGCCCLERCGADPQGPPPGETRSRRPTSRAG